MDIVFENYSTNYFENLTGKITHNCQVFFKQNNFG